MQKKITGIVLFRKQLSLATAHTAYTAGKASLSVSFHQSNHFSTMFFYFWKWLAQKKTVSFVSPKPFSVPRGKAKRNAEGRGETKLTFSRRAIRGASH